MGTGVIRRIAIVLLLGLLLLAAGCDAQEDFPPFDAAKLGSVERDVVYCTAEDGTELKLDIYFPAVDNGPWPVMLHVHGGGWSGGSKNNTYLFPGFTDLGLVGVEIGYRLAPESQFPGQIEDVKCAVRYLRAHAEQYHLDPERFLAIGESAGGHLVSLLGTTGDSGEFNVGEFPVFSSAVQSVIAISAPTNLNDLHCWSPWVQSLASDVFGSMTECGQIDPILETASPLTYVNAGDAPHLILAGTADEIVPSQQAELLDAALQAVDVESRLVIVEGGDHGLNVPGDPSQGEHVMDEIIDFTIEQLGLPRPDWLED